MNETLLTVSDEFLEIYKFFNVNNQVDKIEKLSRKERILLFLLAIDCFSEDNTALLENCKPFKSEIELIYDLQQDKEVDDPDIQELAKLTNEKYIDTTVLRDKNGDKLPNPLTESEAIQLRREVAINKLELGN